MVDNPCTTLTAQFKIVTNYFLSRCEDIVMMRFDGIVSGHVDARGTPFSFSPYMFNGSNRAYYDVHTDSFSGLITSHLKGTGSNYLVNGTSYAYYDINTNVWTGLLVSHLRGEGSNFLSNGSARIYTYLKCPLWATGREGKVCYKRF